MRPKIQDHAGDYDQRVTVERITAAAATNSFGEVDKTAEASWETYLTRWAAIQPVSGREQLRGGQVEPIGLYRMRMRSDSETRVITTEMRIDWNGNKLNIVSRFDKHSQKRELELTLQEAQ